MTDHRACDPLGNTGRLRYTPRHMPKKIELQQGCWYLNSGTWSDLMRLPPDILRASPAEARAKLEPFIQDVAAGQLSRWIVHQPTYVQLDLDESGKVVHADLRSYERASSQSV